MSLVDFERCTPLEFRMAYEAWFERETAAMQREWEIGRFVSMNMLQPYCKKKLKASDICRFPWDKKDGVPRGTSTRDRMEEVMKKLNGRGN